MLRYLLLNLIVSVFLIATLGCGDRAQVGVKKMTKPPEDSPVVRSEDADVDTKPLSPELLDPTLATDQAPEKFQVKFETTKGDFVVEVTREWSPNGADRFYNLVKIGYYDGIAIHRAIKNFMFQFGIHNNPIVTKKWGRHPIPDDLPKGIPNDEGYVSFAKTSDPDSRTTQIFVNVRKNKGLDRQGFTPFGLVIRGFDILKEINTEYGEASPEVIMMMTAQGASYIKQRLPNIDYIKTLSFIEIDEDVDVAAEANTTDQATEDATDAKENK